MVSSVPEIEKLKVSPSASVAVIVSTKFEFSSILKNWPEVISGATSFKLVTLMVRFLSVALVPSDAVAMMLNVSFAS